MIVNEARDNIMKIQLAVIEFLSWSNALNENIIPKGINMNRYGKDIRNSVEIML